MTKFNLKNAKEETTDDLVSSKSIGAQKRTSTDAGFDATISEEEEDNEEMEDSTIGKLLS